eukprot:2989474-Lingulodinium_polyedra.AAC.1
MRSPTKALSWCVWKISTLTPDARPRACRNVASTRAPSCRAFAKYVGNDQPDTVLHSLATISMDLHGNRYV